jgi:mono/diheme cytochrome c family protein
MKKVWVTIGINILLAGCLVFLLFFYEGTQPAPKATADGKTTTAGNPEKIVSTSCMTCHGENLKGGAGPALDKIGAKYAENEIENIINQGKNAMPAGIVSPEEAKVVAEWLAQKK